MKDQQLVQIARQIANVPYEFYTPQVGGNGFWLHDRRKKGEMNSYYHQTQSGLFVKFYSGVPASIFTPWGEWNCWGGGSGREEFFPKILHLLGGGEWVQFKGFYVSFTDKSTWRNDYYQLYPVRIFEGIELPKPIERQPDQFVQPSTATREWERLWNLTS